MVEREVIYQALFDKLSRAAEFNTRSRRWKPFTDVGPEQQPALFMTQVRETAIISTRNPSKWQLEVDVVIYAYSETEQSPMEALNPLLDAVVAAIEVPVGQEEQTLEGLVHRCRVEGVIEIHEGPLGPQAVAIIPIVIITP